MECIDKAIEHAYINDICSMNKSFRFMKNTCSLIILIFVLMISQSSLRSENPNMNDNTKVFIWLIFTFCGVLVLIQLILLTRKNNKLLKHNAIISLLMHISNLTIGILLLKSYLSANTLYHGYNIIQTKTIEVLYDFKPMNIILIFVLSNINSYIFVSIYPIKKLIFRYNLSICLINITYLIIVFLILNTCINIEYNYFMELAILIIVSILCSIIKIHLFTFNLMIYSKYFLFYNERKSLLQRLGIGYISFISENTAISETQQDHNFLCLKSHEINYFIKEYFGKFFTSNLKALYQKLILQKYSFKDIINNFHSLINSKKHQIEYEELYSIKKVFLSLLSGNSVSLYEIVNSIRQNILNFSSSIILYLGDYKFISNALDFIEDDENKSKYTRNYSIYLKEYYDFILGKRLIELYFTKTVSDEDLFCIKKAKEESKMHNQLISKISHEFTTPCIAIQNISDLIKASLAEMKNESVPKTPLVLKNNTKSSKEDAKNNEHRLLRIKYLSEIILILVSDLCEYVKIPRLDKSSEEVFTELNVRKKNATNNANLLAIPYKVKLKKLKVYLQNLCMNLLDIYSKKNFFIKVNFDNELATKQVITDEKKIKQILYNVASNAIKYTKQGGIEISFVSNHIVAEVDEEDSYINIQNENDHLIPESTKHKPEKAYQDLSIIIKDSGEGMPDKLIEALNNSSIVKPNDFTTETTEKHYGMGLYICKKIASQIGVKLQCKDYKNEKVTGTEISLIFNSYLEEIPNIDNLLSDNSLITEFDNIDYKSNNISKLLFTKKRFKETSNTILDNISNIKKNNTETFNSSLNSSIITNSNKFLINLKPMNESSKEMPFEQTNIQMVSKSKISNKLKPKQKSSFANSKDIESLSKSKNFNDKYTKSSIKISSRNLTKATLHRHSLEINKHKNEGFSPIKELLIPVKRHHSLKKRHIQGLNINSIKRDYKDKSNSKIILKEFDLRKFKKKSSQCEVFFTNNLKDSNYLTSYLPTQKAEECYKILLIDDNNTILSSHYTLFKDYFATRGVLDKFEILKLNDGIEGLYEIYKDHILCNKSIKLIVCDQDMNFMKGSELYSFIKDKFKTYIDLFIIASALQDNEFGYLIKSIGVDCYAKPLSRSIVEGICTKYLADTIKKNTDKLN